MQRMVSHYWIKQNIHLDETAERLCFPATDAFKCMLNLKRQTALRWVQVKKVKQTGQRGAKRSSCRRVQTNYTTLTNCVQGRAAKHALKLISPLCDANIKQDQHADFDSTNAQLDFGNEHKLSACDLSSTQLTNLPLQNKQHVEPPINNFNLI